MQVYHLKSSCQAKMVIQPKWLEIGLGGNELQGLVIILDIGIDLGNELWDLVNTNSIPLTYSTTLLIPI